MTPIGLYFISSMIFRLNLSPFVPLSLKGEGEELGEGALPLQAAL